MDWKQTGLRQEGANIKPNNMKKEITENLAKDQKLIEKQSIKSGT